LQHIRFGWGQLNAQFTQIGIATILASCGKLENKVSDVDLQ
jgi:hypothetical protein